MTKASKLLKTEKDFLSIAAVIVKLRPTYKLLNMLKNKNMARLTTECL